MLVCNGFVLLCETGTERVEIRCRRCDSHIGHVFFNEMGASTERHCANGRALKYHDGAEPENVRTGPLQPDVHKEKMPYWNREKFKG